MTDNSTPPTGHKKSSLLSRLLRFGLPLIMSVGLCYVLFHGMDFRAMLEYIKHDCSFEYIFLSMMLGLVAYLFRALRWRLQLRASDINPPLLAMYFSISGTYAVNLVFPRLGEVWRSEYIARRQNASFTTVLGSMIADRLADTLTVLLLLVITFFIAGTAVEGFITEYPATYNAVRSFISSPFTYIVAAAIILLCRFFYRHKWHNRWLIKLQEQVHNLVGGFTAIFHMRHKGRWLLLTVLLWGTYFAQLWICMYAFGYTRAMLVSHGPIIVLVCFVLSSLSMGIPTYGGIGPYQLALMFGLRCFYADLDQEKAAAFANVVLGAQTVLVIIAGLATFAGIAIDNRRLAKKITFNNK